ncbi:MAG TPA: FAD-dependent oxidoreductase [Gemmataceae bacterium]|nr:FAD-dependent oxidoreductase [Gemmataceae bacterium]
MPVLFIVGGGLFGSLAASHARSKGIEAVVFDSGLEGAASPAAAGLFKEGWVGKKLREHYVAALPLLDRLYGIRHVALTSDDGGQEAFLFVPPTAILEPAPIRARVTSIGDGWLEAEGRRYEGWVYIAAGIWCGQFLPDLNVYGKAGSSFVFPGERPGRIRPIERGRQAIAFVRDPGSTHFSDGTAEREYIPQHDRQTLARAADMGLVGEPSKRYWGCRPYTPGGPVFQKISPRTWLATGGRKMGTILGASFARRLIEELC